MAKERGGRLYDLGSVSKGYTEAGTEAVGTRVLPHCAVFQGVVYFKL